MRKPFTALTTTFADPDHFEDATESYGDREIFDLLDADNDCVDAGGHVFLADHGQVTCIRCGRKVK